MAEIERKEIIDNSKDNKMRNHLTQRIPIIDQLDISTAYFDHKGYGMLRDVLVSALNRNTFNMRLILGSNSLTNKIITDQQEYVYFGEKSLISSLHNDEFDIETETDVGSLINALKKDNFQVRHSTGKFNHSKCYIVGKNTLFIGSSNFTGKGLDGNTELNAGIYQPLAIDECKKWFEQRWNDSVDIKNELIDTLERSKFGIPAEPFEIYMKILFERFKERLKKPINKSRSSEDLAMFQQEALQSSIQILADIDGVLIADSTGLGKTNIGIEVLHHKQFHENSNIMLIAPSQVLHGMWDGVLKKLNIGISEKITTEELGRDGGKFDDIDPDSIDVVLIDESQNFRNNKTKRYQKLMRFLTSVKKKQVILMSATPINNSLMDLYNQLALITGNNPGYFKTIGIPDLERHMKEANKEDDFIKGLGKIEQLLDSVMIRQTRTFVQETYPDDMIQGKKIKFPKHEYAPIQYSITDNYGNIFSEILICIESLTMAPYSLKYYDTGLSVEEQEEFKHAGNLQTYFLFKMFDSSIKAGEHSVKNRLKLYEQLKDSINNNKMFKIDDFNKVLRKWTHYDLEDDPYEDSSYEGFINELKTIEKETIPSSYDKKQLLKDIESDIEMLKKILEISKRVKIDHKVESVMKQIIKDDALEKDGKKVLIFTEYVTTALHITNVLKNDYKFKNKTIECITGNTDSKSRSNIIQRFAPIANPHYTTEKSEIDILVSTEVLSEGQNLQDCNYVINYDIPWNPMRIVQRTGRVDRLTSQYDKIYTRACFPEDDLDNIISIVGKVMKKLNKIKGTIGLDVEVLGELPNPKEFGVNNIINVLSDNTDPTIIDRLQRESDMMPQTTSYNIISKHVKNEGIGNMEDVPMSRRSGKKGDTQKIVLAFLDDRSNRIVYFVNYDYTDDTVEIIDQDKAISDIKCESNEPTYMPMDVNDHHESFKILQRAYNKGITRIIEYSNEDVLVPSKKTSSIQKTVSELQNVIIQLAIKNVITADKSDDLLKTISLDRVYGHEQYVKNILKDYQQTSNNNKLVSSIESLEKSLIPIDKDTSKQKLEPTDLKLIGAMFITGDQYKPPKKVDQYS